MQSVPHAVSLGLEIALVVLIWYYFDRHILCDFESISLQADTLYRVVCEQAHLVHAEVAEHLCAASVVTLIWLETEVYVGIYGIVSFFLQFVGCNLVHQPDASAFLLHVDDYTLSGFLDHLHRP